MYERVLGASGLKVAPIGMGCMAFSHGYGKIPDEGYSIEAIQKAHEFGCDFYDTAEAYGPNLMHPGHNEKIVGKAVRNFRKDIVLATKLFIPAFSGHGGNSLYKAIRHHLEASMDRLGTDYIDLYYLHRVSHSASVEAVAEVMGLLMEDGLIMGWGLSQVSAATLAKAHEVTPVSAIQNLYNMLERDCEEDIFPYCMEHNIAVVPFSPIGSGLLSGKITVDTKFEKKDDVRNWVPQLSRQNIIGNQPIIDIITGTADRKGCTNAQIALAWMLHKYPNAIPIPGSKNQERILENLAAWNVEFTEEEFQMLEDSLNACRIYGHRGHVEE